MEDPILDTINNQTMDVDNQQYTESEEDVLREGEEAVSSADLMRQQCKEEFMEKFHPHQVYQSPNHLCQAISDLACKFNFSVSKDGRQIKCSRALDKAKAKKRADRKANGSAKRETPSYQVPCPFKITWNYTQYIPFHERPPDQKNKQLRYSDECRIISVCADHGSKCGLSCMEMKVTLRRGGFLSQFESQNIARVVNMVVQNPNMPAASIRAVLRDHLPPGYELSAQDCCNFRIWCKQNFHRLDKEGVGVSFQKNEIGSALTRWRNNKGILPTMKDAGEALQEVLIAKMNEKNSVVRDKWDVELFLQIQKQKDPSFDYRIITDNKKEAMGVVWQTGFQREAFKRYGDVLFLDMMKRKLNHLHWPYFAPVVVDCDSHIMTACEAIVCAETVDSYYFVLNAMFEMSVHARERQDVRCMFSDKFLDQNNSATLLAKLQINTTCRLFWDYYHITSDIWPKAFGQHYQGSLKTKLKALINSKSLEHFDETVSQIEILLEPFPKLLGTLHEWCNNQKYWAKHQLDAWYGTLGKRGSSHAEQNHSSVLAHGGTLFEDPIQQIKQLLDRNAFLFSKTNQKFHEKNMCIAGETAHYPNQNLLPNHVWAKKLLGTYAYKHWNEELLKSKEYLHHMFEENGETIWEIWHPGNPLKKRLISDSSGCQCWTRKHLRIQCRHYLVVEEGQFKPLYFDNRWLCPQSITVCFRASVEEVTASVLQEDVGLITAHQPIPPLPITDNREDTCNGELMQESDDDHSVD